MSILSFFSKKEPVKLPFHTDIHCHIVPGVDDGSPDASTSADLVERMQGWGISRIIATPHVTEATFENTPEILDPALDELRQELARRGNGIEVIRSSENRIDDFTRELLEKGMIKPMPGNYLLIECSFLQEPMMLDQFIYGLKMQGYKPILAHPERYYYYHDNYRRYAELHNLGTLFQINVLSLAGYYSKHEKKVAERLIEMGCVDFLGTDLHNHRHADSIDHYLTTSDARRHATALEARIFNDRVFRE
jgi:tyrosine-protein phosphatase YwqE